MKLGEAFWMGRHELVTRRLESMAPSCLDGAVFFQAATIKTGRYRAGIAFDKSAINAYKNSLNPFFLAWRDGMEVHVAATESTERAIQAVKALDATVSDFNKNLKNDLVSMKAASQRIQSESLQMRDRYLEAQAVLTSPEFERAIQNAERMAIALQSLAALSETSLSVSVLAAGNGATRD
jgi:hypothetical protein